MARTSTYSLSVGELLAKSFGIYFKNLVPFVFLTALIFAPWIVLRIMLDMTKPSRELTIGVNLLQTVLNPVLIGAATYGVVQRLRGQPASIGQTITIGLQSFLRVALTAIVVGILTGLCFLLLVVPGIIASVVWYVAIPVAVMEGKAVGDAMRRSSSLTTGSRWQIFATWLVVAVIGGVIAAVAGYVFVAMRGHSIRDLEAAVLPAWFDITVVLLLTPLSAIMSGVCYFLLRTGKEGADACQLAAVFD